jgi:hypothetical protein
MADKLTRHKSGITIVTEDFANSVYGGLYGKPEASGLDPEHPLVAGHVHDGQHLDGHAQKINLEDHVAGQLDGANIQDGTISASKLDFTPGGGGAIIIPDGDSFGGVYSGPVICEGDATINDNLNIRGSLLVLGNITNNQGYLVEIDGDMIVKGDILFDHNDSSQPQSNFVVTGDLLCGNLSFKQSGGIKGSLNVARLIVGGNFTSTIMPSGATPATITVDLSGVDGTGSDGGILLVGGDVGVDYLNSKGGTNSASLVAGDGGILYVHGNFTGLDVDISGGSGSNLAGGNGGSLDTIIGYINIDSFKSNGGNGLESIAGNGGSVSSGSYATFDTFESKGGICNSVDPSHYPGVGGNLSIFGGDLFVSNDINQSGGNRLGTLASSLDPGILPNAGILNVFGDCHINQLVSVGGSIQTNNNETHDAGQGGIVTVYGNLKCQYTFNISGGQVRPLSGSPSSGNGGLGGTLNVFGNATFYSGELNCSGGDSDNGSGGQGGTVLVERGSLSVYEFYSNGGEGIDGDGGFGGAITSSSFCITGNYCELSGGSCDSINSSFRSGSGGTIIANSISSVGQISLNAGSRNGATTSTAFTKRNGGSITCNGNFSCTNNISLNGSIVLGGTDGFPGGNGGSLTVSGNFSLNGIIELNGGSSNVNNGGNGGTILIHGPATSTGFFYSLGGDCDTASPYLNGQGGQISFFSGVCANGIVMTDGVGSGDPPPLFTEVKLLLAGACNIRSIDMTSGVSHQIVGDSNKTTTLKVSNLLNKNTFNNSSLAETSDATSIAGGLTNIFSYDPALGSWYYHSAAAL